MQHVGGVRVEDGVGRGGEGEGAGREAGRGRERGVQRVGATVRVGGIYIEAERCSVRGEDFDAAERVARRIAARPERLRNLTAMSRGTGAPLTRVADQGGDGLGVAQPGEEEQDGEGGQQGREDEGGAAAV